MLKVALCAFRAWLFHSPCDLEGVGAMLRSWDCSQQLSAFANQRPIYMHFMWQRLLLFLTLLRSHLLLSRPPTEPLPTPPTTTYRPPPIDWWGSGVMRLPINFSIAGGVTFTAFYCYFEFLWFFNSNN